jgi:iron complex outermembrane recepter protein
MAAYSFKLAGAKVTAQLNITNLFDRTYYTAASNFANVATAGPGFGFFSLRSYGAPFAALGSLRPEF